MHNPGPARSVAPVYAASGVLEVEWEVAILIKVGWTNISALKINLCAWTVLRVWFAFLEIEALSVYRFEISWLI